MAQLRSNAQMQLDLVLRLALNKLQRCFRPGSSADSALSHALCAAHRERRMCYLAGKPGFRLCVTLSFVSGSRGAVLSALIDLCAFALSYRPSVSVLAVFERESLI
jgi:hypothetical protein